MSSVSQYLPNIIAALASGALGYGATRGATKRLPTEDDDEFEKRRSLNSGIGAVSGAALGAAAPMLAPLVMPKEKGFDPVGMFGAGVDKVIEGVGPIGAAGAIAGGYKGHRDVVRNHAEAVRLEASNPSFTGLPISKSPTLKQRAAGTGVGAGTGLVLGALIQGLGSRYIQ